MDERSARLAANEAIFRAGNELIERAVAGSRPEEVPFSVSAATRGVSNGWY
jgi:hypothetical protein